ncbi:Sesquiterpene synthase [Bienertia sinuspersici]
MSVQSSQSQKSRPIANFHPCLWGDHFLNITNPLHDSAVQVEKEIEVKQLKEKVRKELVETKGKPLEQLNVIDVIERLGWHINLKRRLRKL